MKTSTKLFFFLLTLCIARLESQDFKQQFGEKLSANDSIGQLQVLEKWEKSSTGDAELYIAWFNYYIRKSMKEMITMGNDPKGKEVMKLSESGDTSKKPVVYLYGDTYYDRVTLEKGLDSIDKAIKRYPSRLDMRFGRIHMYGVIKDYETFTKGIVQTIDYSNIIKNNWKWSDNKDLEDPKKFMLTSIQDYVIQLYDTGDDSLLNNMKQIAEAILTYYPDHVESLSNLSIVFTLQNNYDKSLEVLLKAEKLAPTDFIVLSNAAHAYKLKGDKENAVKYYELTLKYGDEQAKEYAQKQLDELKKK